MAAALGIDDPKFVRDSRFDAEAQALELTQRAEQRRDPALKGLRWSLLKDRSRLSDTRRADLGALLAYLTTKRNARALQYREDLRETLNR